MKGRFRSDDKRRDSRPGGPRPSRDGSPPRDRESDRRSSKPHHDRQDQRGRDDHRPRRGEDRPRRFDRDRDRDHGDDARHGAAPGQPRFTRPKEDLVRVAGLPSVLELYRAAPDRIERLYFEASLRNELEDVCAHLARRRKVYRQLGADEMERVAATVMHGGVVALSHPRPIKDLDLAEAEVWAARKLPLLVLDGIGNPQNIGAIARTAAFFGIEHVILSAAAGQSRLSDAAHRVAKGGLEHITFHRAADVAATLRRLAKPYYVVGTAIDEGTELRALLKPDKPIALVLGNEEGGLSPSTLAACTSVVSLRGSGHVQSLNVSAAAAILIHALLARR